LLIALLAAVISTVIGTLAAIGIHVMKKKTKTVVFTCRFLAIGLKLGFTSMLIAHIPYVILNILPKLSSLNEAALDLGAHPMQAIWKVIIPEIMPNIITGFLLAFTLSLDDFIISYFTTGSGVTNLSITIYTMTRRGIKPEINAVSTVMFLSILILLLIINKRSEKNNKKLGGVNV